MLRFQQGVLQTNVEVVEIHIMQEHIDAAEVVGGRIHLLTKVL